MIRSTSHMAVGSAWIGGTVKGGEEAASSVRERAGRRRFRPARGSVHERLRSPGSSGKAWADATRKMCAVIQRILPREARCAPPVGSLPAVGAPPASSRLRTNAPVWSAAPPTRGAFVLPRYPHDPRRLRSPWTHRAKGRSRAPDNLRARRAPPGLAPGAFAPLDHDRCVGTGFDLGAVRAPGPTTSVSPLDPRPRSVLGCVAPVPVPCCSWTKTGGISPTGAFSQIPLPGCRRVVVLDHSGPAEGGCRKQRFHHRSVRARNGLLFYPQPFPISVAHRAHDAEHVRAQ